MSRGVNKVILVGNLGQKPEMRYTATQTAVANLSIATTESWKDKESGENRDKTEWHRVVFFGSLAEIAEKYLRKGQKVYIEGKLKKRSWQDKDGNTRYTTEVVGDELTMLSRADQNQQTSSAPYSSEGTPNQPSKVDDIINNDSDDLPF